MYFTRVIIPNVSQDIELKEKLLKVDVILKTFLISESNQITVIVNTSVSDHIMKFINKEGYYYSIITIKLAEKLNHKLKRKLNQNKGYFLVFIEDFSDMQSVTKEMTQIVLWKYSTKFVFVIMRAFVEEPSNPLQDIFKSVRRSNIFQGLAIFWSDDHVEMAENISVTNQHLKVLLYESSHCPEETINLTDISENWLTFEDKYFVLAESMNHTCPKLRVSMFPEPSRAMQILEDGIFKYGGYDGFTVEAIAEYMNMTIDWLLINPFSSYGYSAENGTILGTTGDVAYGRADIAANSRLISPGWHEVKFTYPHDVDNLIVIVPKAKRIPQYKNIFLPFTLLTWILLLITFLFTFLSWYCIRRCVQCLVRDTMVSVTFVKAFLDVFRSFVTGSMSLRFHSTIERIFMVIWVLFGIIMTSAFQGSLTSYLSVPKYLKDINTLKEVVESNIWLFIYGTDNTVSFLDQDDESMARLRRKLIITPNLFEAFDKITKQDDVGFVMNEYGAKFMLSSREFTKEGYPILHGVKQSLLTNYNAYEIPRHSPYLDTFNLVIRRLTESGFQRKWYRDTNHQHSLNGNFTDSFFLNNARASPLTLKHMQTSFYILMFGLFISFVAFLTEVCR